MDIFEGPEIEPQPGDYYVDGLLYCGKCHTRRQAVIDWGGQPRAVNCICQCENDRWMQDQKRMASNFRKQVLDNTLARVPAARAARRTFADCDELTPADLLEVSRSFADTFEQRKDGLGLLFFGETDQGKTFMAECIVNALLAKNIAAAIVSVAEFTNSVNIKNHNEAIAGIMSPALVVLDDVGAERASEYAQQILFEAIDGRYAQHLPMIVTTNLSREALASKGQSVKNRTYERLLEVCLPIEVDAGRRRYSAESYEQMRLAFIGAE